MKPLKFMFFDYWPYEYLKGFKIKQGSPKRCDLNPLFTKDDNPKFRSMNYHSVIFDKEENIFKLWYGTRYYNFDTKESIQYLCYSTSKDGLHFKKYKSKLYEGTNYVTKKDDNAMGMSIIKDVDDNEYPYKLLMRPKFNPNVVAYNSKNGIDWQAMQKNPVIRANSDCQVSLYKHTETKKYMACFRDNIGNRRVWQAESDDMITWSRPILTLSAPIEDGPQTQIYSYQASQYGAFSLGFSPMYNTEESDFGIGKMYGTVDIKLAFSRGGYDWQWAHGKKRFMKTGNEDSYDSKMIFTSSSPVYLDDEIRIYYTATRYDHGDREGYYKYPQNFNLAKLRPDGYSYIECEDKGSILTRCFSVYDDGIYLNCDSSNGEILVELLDDKGNAIKGYEKENCIPIKEDNLKKKVEWKNPQDKELVVKKEIRVKLYAKKSKVYSITFNNGLDDFKYYDFVEGNFSRPLHDTKSGDFFMHV